MKYSYDHVLYSNKKRSLLHGTRTGLTGTVMSESRLNRRLYGSIYMYMAYVSICWWGSVREASWETGNVVSSPGLRWNGCIQL